MSAETIAEVLAAHWSFSTDSDQNPFVDRCDGCKEAVYSWGSPSSEQQKARPAHQAQMVAAALAEHDAEVAAKARADLMQLLADMTDPDDCWFDHNGGCQAHGYLTLKPGELCPHAEAKKLLAEDQP